MISHAHRIKDEIPAVLLFVAAIWTVFLLDQVIPLRHYGLAPRSIPGLAGIATMPFLHNGFDHLTSNTVPLTVLLLLLAGSRNRSWVIVLLIVLLSGGLLWLVGRPVLHIGASALIFGLAAFLLVSGFVERRFVPLAIAVLVGVLYGSTLLWGVLPTVEGVSWDGHLSGIIAGTLTAWGLKSRPNR